MRKAQFGVLLILILSCQICLSATVEDGYDAFERGDVDAGITIWRELAKQGNAAAQLNMGQLYRLGNGVEASDREAVRWYTQAALQGSSIAKYNLAMMHEDGRASDADLEKVFGTPDPVSDADSNLQNDADDTSNKWISGVSPDTSLIQLLGSSNRQALKDYSSTHLNEDFPPSQVIATRMMNRDWYLLILGPFNTRERAEGVMNRLPVELKNQGPWIRTAESVQAIAISSFDGR